MKTRFGPTLDDVAEQIDEALGHSAAKKWTDQQAYVRNWLRRASKNGSDNKPSRLTAPAGKSAEEREAERLAPYRKMQQEQKERRARWEAEQLEKATAGEVLG
jgi:hypothetical protein